MLPIDEINLDYSKETGKKNLNIKEEFTFLITSSRLLIGGIDVFQVWDLIQTEGFIFFKKNFNFNHHLLFSNL